MLYWMLKHWKKTVCVLLCFFSPGVWWEIKPSICFVTFENKCWDKPSRMRNNALSIFSYKCTKIFDKNPVLWMHHFSMDASVWDRPIPALLSTIVTSLPSARIKSMIQIYMQPHQLFWSVCHLASYWITLYHAINTHQYIGLCDPEDVYKILSISNPSIVSM